MKIEMKWSGKWALLPMVIVVIVVFVAGIFGTAGCDDEECLYAGENCNCQGDDCLECCDGLSCGYNEDTGYSTCK